jgi:hypothetical protein
MTIDFTLDSPDKTAEDFDKFHIFSEIPVRVHAHAYHH